MIKEIEKIYKLVQVDRLYKLLQRKQSTFWLSQSGLNDQHL